MHSEAASAPARPLKMALPPQNLLRMLLAIQPTFFTVFAATAVMYFLIQPPEYATTDGYMRELVARNLIDYRDPALVQVERGETLNNLWSIGRGGRPYTYFGLGQSILLVPFMLLIDGLNILGIGEYLSPTIGLPMALVMSLSGGLLVAFVFSIAQELGYSRRTSLIVAALLAFASTLWGMIRSSFDMSIEAALVMGAIYFVIAAQHHEKWRRLRLVVGGLCFGFAVVTRIGALIAGPALAILLLLEPERPFLDCLKMAILFGLGAAAIIWVVPLYNWLRYEDALSSGYIGHYPYAGGPLLRGIAQWILSPWEGAVVYMPVLLGLPLAWRSFSQKYPHLLRVLALLFLSYLLFHAQFVGLGNSGWGPYYIMTGIFPLYLLFADFIENWSARPQWQRGIVSSLIAISFVIQLAAISVPLERHQVERVVYQAQGLGDYENFNFFNVEWSPIVRQSRATINNIGNLFHYQDFLGRPPSMDYPVLIERLFAYNLPDWWWLYKFLHRSEVALIVPLVGLSAAVWMVTHLLYRPGKSQQEIAAV